MAHHDPAVLARKIRSLDRQYTACNPKSKWKLAKIERLALKYTNRLEKMFKK